MNIQFNNKVVIVTGAGSGIGRASARRFAALGARVVVNDIDESSAQETVSLISNESGVALAAVADVTQAEQVDTLVSTALEAFGQLDVMFNNAGGAFPTPMLGIDTHEFQRLFALNFNAAYFGTMAALRVMLPQSHGCILATTSGASLGAVPGLAVYGAAKAAINALMRSVAAEHGKHGIRANAIAPGPMETPALTRWLETLPGGIQAYNDAQPQGRLGKPEEIADAAAYLASEYASFINGSVIPVDGAVHALLAVPR